MPESETTDLDLVLAAEQDILRNTTRYREAIAWWNDSYSRRVYRKKVADDLRQRRRSGEKLRRTRHGEAWHHEHRADWFFLARARDAMHTFPTDSAKWRRLGLRDATRILLVTVLITRPDFDGARVGLDERAQWSNGGLLNNDECFGREWADGSFASWDDEFGANGLWLKLARAAWKVVQAAVATGTKPEAEHPSHRKAVMAGIDVRAGSRFYVFCRF